MLALIDPTTSLPLPADTIQRVLFVSPSVHVYSIPPLTSTKGYLASTWTSPPAHQFPPCRLRILETAFPTSNSPSSSTSTAITTSTPTPPKLKIDLLLEDPQTTALFAASPYTTATAVEQVLDSSRFFAVRVEGEGGRKAVLGIGFEERSEAFDFGIVLQECRKVLGWDKGPGEVGGVKGGLKGGRGPVVKEAEVRRDFSLKEGQTIHVELSGVSRRRREEGGGGSVVSPAWIAPPSGGGLGMGFLPPPPSAEEVKAEKRRVRQEEKGDQELGFDDGEFGEFQ